MINVGAIVCMGRISCSPQLLGACAQNGIAISFMTQNGRFLAAVNGFTPGNVLLRREQYRRADDPAATAAIARACIIGKLSNYRAVRDQTASEATTRLEKIGTRIDMRLRTLQTEFYVDQLRGVEGDASADYFEVFNDLITKPDEDSLRFYMLGNEWKHRVEHIGVKPSVDLDEPLIF
jgi:CRISPR-associated protein Cas1